MLDKPLRRVAHRMVDFSNMKQTLALKTSLVLMTLGTCLFIFFLTLSVFSFVDIRASQQQAERSSIELADMLALQSLDAINSKNGIAGNQVLSALIKRTDVTESAIVLTDGTVFSTFGIGDTKAEDVADKLVRGTHVDETRLSVVQDIFIEGSRVGAIYIQAKVESTGSIVASNVAKLIPLFGLAAVICVLVVLRLHRLFVAPIIACRQIIENVTRKADYTQRTEPLRNDELGAMLIHFNLMMAEIEKRDIEHSDQLGTIRQALEDRTGELAVALESVNASARAKSEFLAMMSHEIRTPMNGVIGMSEILMESNLPSEEREYIETINASGHSLLNIINDILDFSKLESGNLIVDNVHFSIRDLVSQVVDIQMPRVVAEGIKLEMRVDPQLPDDLFGDPVRIRQILLNLLSNAIKFTEKGYVHIDVQLQQQLSDVVTICFVVEDTGIGIEEEKISAIFDDFSQADGSMTREYGGTGLGLSIAKKLTELMSGHMSATSTMGVGSVFKFDIQLNKCPDTMVELDNTRVLRGKTAIVFEPNEIKQNILSELLESWQVGVSAMRDSDELLFEIQKATSDNALPDFLIINVEQPDIELEFFLQSFGDLASETSLVLMLSRLDEKGQALYGKMGYNHQVLTPIHEKQLRHALMDQLGTSSINQTETEEQVFTEVEEANESLGRVLVVDDNLVNQKVALVMVQKLGYSVDAAVDGAEAVAAWQSKPYDLILMDCQMPVMDGYEATEKIRALEDNNAHVPILALTANAMQGDREKCMDCGMDDFMAKPIKRATIEAMLGRYTTGSTTKAIPISQNPSGPFTSSSM